MTETFEDYALPPDSLLNGKYVIQRVLGRGGFGVTYLALDKTLNLRVAVKECLPRNAAWRDLSGVSVQWGVPAPQQEITLENFVREARKMAQIDRIPGVVRVREYFFENNSAYIAMDYVEGETLAERLKRTGPMGADECFRLLSPVMDALGQAHRRGLVHRDISPNNIMISHAEVGGERAWLLDLGAAKDLGTRLFAPNVSAATQIVGTPGYAPLEQYAPDGKIGPWTDVYAMSAMFLRCMTGQAPPPSTSRALQDSVPELLRTAPGAIGTALLKGLARNPEDRYQSMGELRDALEKALPKPKRAFPIKALIFAAVLLVAASVSLFVALSHSDSVKESNDETENSANSADAASNGAIGTVASGECGGNASWTLDADGLLTIFGTWKMADYDDGTAPWTDYLDSIFSVKILQGISSIGRKSFWYCENLQSVEIPDSITTIEFCAFLGCRNLNGVAIPDSVTTIGNSVFYGCENLADVTLPKKLTEIGAQTFCDCKSLKNVAIPNSVTTIGSEAFLGCVNLESVSIPDSVTKIGGSAFSGCSALSNIKIPKSVKIIEYAVFRDCVALKSVAIPNGATKIGGNAFDGCSNLTSVIIPESVTKIEANAFLRCASLTGVTIPDSVAEIEEYAFSGCGALTSVSIPNSVLKIGYRAFSDCANLNSASVSAKTVIEDGAFDGHTVITYR